MATHRPIVPSENESRDLWMKAAATLSDEEKEVLKIEELKGGNVAQAVLQATRTQRKRCEDKQWSFTFKGKRILVRDVLESIISWTEKFKEVVDFAVSMDATGHAALPWACVKFCFEIAEKDFQRYGSMLLGIEFVAREIQFYTLFEKVYLKKPSEAANQLADTLVQTYGSLLQYLAKAYTYYSKHTLARAITAPFSEDGVGNMMDSVEKSRNLIEQNARLIDKETSDEERREISEAIRVWKKPLESMATQVTEISKLTKDNLLVTKEILSIIKASPEVDPLITIREFMKLPPALEINREYRDKAKKLVSGTGTWIFKQQEFENWSQGRKSLLTITGSPGCGKSYLSTTVIKHAPQIMGKHVAIGHYYFHDNHESKRSVKSALCAMIYQIAEQNVYFAESAARTCRQFPNSLAATLASIWYDFFLSKFDSDSGEKACLIFDGIDEAMQEDMAELTRLLHESLISDTNIQVLLVGRPEIENVTLTLNDFSAGSIDVSSKLNTHDISLFVDYSYGIYLSKHKIRGLRETVTTSLREKANGMFLWVDLVCQELAKIKNVKVLKQHLDSMPAGLSALYETIFSRMAAMGSDSKRPAQLKELFCCLSQSAEPPSVFILNHVIQYATDDPEFDVELAITESCASLVSCEETGRLLFRRKIDSENNQKRIHNSVKSFNSGGEDAGEGDDADSASLLDEDAAQQEEENRQKEIQVKVRHASIGDFLNSKGLKTSAILFSRGDATFHSVELSLRIILEGVSAPVRISDLWLYAMTNIFDQLRNLDERSISPQQTVFIIEGLWQLFNSEPLAKYISQHHSTPTGYPLHDSFFFGFNTDLGHTNRQAVRKWIEKANSLEVIELKPATRQWADKIIAVPLQLLVPLTKVCIHEWLHSDEPPSLLYWRWRFAWLCLVATDLIPSCDPFSWHGPEKYPSFGSSDSFNYLADIVKAERSVDVLCHIAKTMAFIGEGAIAEIEWNKAIELAETAGEEDRLKELYYEFILSLTDIRLMQCEPAALQLAEKYLALDSSNYKMQACLALAHFTHLDDGKGAIEGFRTSLSLEPQDHSVLKALLHVFWSEDNLEGIMEMFNNKDTEITSGRIRACIDSDYFQNILFLAARETGKIEYLVECYETEIARPWTEPSISNDKDPRDEEIWTEIDEAFGIFNRQEFYSAGTALLRCRLAVLHQRYREDSRAALHLWTTVFLEQTEIFRLSDISSKYPMDTLPMFVAMFAELLFEDAVKPDGSVDKKSIRSLERLRYRHDLFSEYDGYGASLTNERSLNLFLAKLYCQIGRNDEAEELLKQQFERGIELLNDDIDWNDSSGYHVLSKILFSCGQKENAAIAQFLRRYSRYQPEEEEEVDGSRIEETPNNKEGEEKQTEEPQPPYKKEDAEDGDSDEERPIGVVERLRRGRELGCSMQYDCSKRKTLNRKSPLFTCMTCVHVQFCDDCYARHTSGVGNSTVTTADQRHTEEGKLISVCSSRHEHIKVPPNGWRLKGDVITIEGKDISTKMWLEALYL